MFNDTEFMFEDAGINQVHRFERHKRRIRNFLSSTRESIQMNLYTNEIHRLRRDCPEVMIERTGVMYGTGMYECQITKKDP